MNIFARPPITNPFLGFLLGLAAFLLSFLVKAVIGRIVEVPLLTGFLMGLTGLFLLLLSTGNWESPQKFFTAVVGAYWAESLVWLSC